MNFRRVFHEHNHYFSVTNYCLMLLGLFVQNIYCTFKDHLNIVVIEKIKYNFVLCPRKISSELRVLYYLEFKTSSDVFLK